MLNHMTCSLDDLKNLILEDGIIDSEEVSLLKARLYDDGVIDSEEADFLFALNDATTDTPGHSTEWSELFVQAISDFVLSDEISPGVVDADEANYLINKIGADGKVDSNELGLLVNVVGSATGESPDFFNDYVLNALRDAIIADGIVDAEEVSMMRTVIYGPGGAGGADVDRSEATMLFAVNDATEDNDGHDASWCEFFVEAIGKHVLEDEASPGAIDSEEGDWLDSMLTAKGGDDFGPLEVALVAHIKSNAVSIGGAIASKI